MNCANHPDRPAAAYCRACGTPLCEECQRRAGGAIYCAEHAPAEQTSAPAPPVTAPPAGTPVEGTSPGLAFLLGLIPGVGAVYNGQYAKGLVHVLIFGLLISIMASDAAHGMEPLFGLISSLFYFYMPFEAYHTAKKRQRGEYVDEFSSLVPLRPQRPGSTPIVGPVLLIALGVLFLLHTMGVLEFRRIIRYWPVLLIALGVYMLYTRLAGENGKQEAGNE